MEKEGLRLLQNEVTSLRAEGKYKETIETGYSLLQHGSELNDSKSILVAHLNIAASYYCIGDIEEAFHSIDAYDEVCGKYGDDIDFLQLYNVLFLLYEFNKDYGKAKEILKKSIALGKRLKKYNIVSNGYSNCAHIHLKEGNFEKALEMAKTGLEMAKLHEPASSILEFRVTLNIAQAYIGLGDLDAAENLISQMGNNLDLNSFIREKSQFYMLRGSLYFHQKLYREAFNTLTKAKELVESYNDLYLLKDIQEERSKLADLMGDISIGYVVQKEYISLLNEINNRELSLTALKLDVKHSLSTMERKANTDYLTGLYNRNYIEETTNTWLVQASETQESIICIVIDIDHFKYINDHYGHLFGDEVIKKVSQAISQVIEENELIGRYGGDEFVIILKNTKMEYGKRKAELILEAVKDLKISKGEKLINLTTSIGIADNDNGRFLNFREIFDYADSVLYQAKENGRNQFRIKDSYIKS